MFNFKINGNFENAILNNLSTLHLFFSDGTIYTYWAIIPDQ